MNTKNVITVYAELTPNPNTMKFVANVMLLEGGVVEYSDKSRAADCPLAFQLFDFSGVKGVFITDNFITVTKDPAMDWYDITNILREFIRGFLLSDEKLFTANPFQPGIGTRHEQGEKTKTPAEVSGAGDSPEVDEKIKSLLDEYVKPAVEQDGGAIFFKSFHEGIVTLSLKGSCSGCPSSTLTLKAGIENLLKKMIPEVTEVVAEAE